MIEGILENAVFRNISMKITQDKVNKMINESFIMMVLSQVSDFVRNFLW